MTRHLYKTAAARSSLLRRSAALLCLAGAAIMAAPTTAGTPFLMDPKAAESLWSAEAAATNPETVRLLAGLVAIRNEMLLGQLFLQGNADSQSPHFVKAHVEVLPTIRDGLAAAGAPDLEPALAALVAASDSAAVGKAQLDVELAVGKAEAALKPTEQDRVAATVEAVRAATGLIDASGTTDLASYQEAWGLILSAQDFLDELAASKDPVIKSKASAMVAAFDDVILSLPDPMASGPVDVDPALIGGLLGALEQAMVSA